ncbi:MAG: metallophosphoesterase [Alcanivoracaceae bacterium]|nr:metallophosphoesterase [Alcanivoracaceae bacterium]
MQQRTNIPKPYFPDKKSRSPMVPWFSPIILLKTVKDLVLSKIVGSQLDTRELQSVNEDAQDATQKQFNCKIAKFYTVQDNQEDFYFDFIADTGDGWDSTYTIASLLSRDYLLVNDDNKIKKLPRGDFLLMGGDEVYPGPSEAAYEARLIKPYQHAWDWLWLNDTDNAAGTRNTGSFLKLKNQPDVYAIPGNHDWYDSLIAFRKVFCSIFKTKHIGQWQAKQSRSYFALGLPHDWVILAFDFGLDQYKLDGLQYHYFQNIVNNLDSKNKLIILIAEPLWVYGGVQNKKLHQAYKDIEDLIEGVFSNKSQDPPKIYLNLSGDTHNYQRYESLSDESLNACMSKCSKQNICSEEQKNEVIKISQKQHKRQHIVAGGGGAFLHPTHSTTQKNMRIILNESFSLGGYSAEPYKSEVEVKDMYELKHCYPDVETSRKLANKLLFNFLPNNIKLGLFIATVYLVLAWPMRAFLDSIIIQKLFNGFADSGLNFLTLLLSSLLVLGFTLWARSRPGLSLTMAGYIHGMLQVSLLYGGYVFVYLFMVNIWQSYELQYGWFLFPIVRDIIYFILISTVSPLLLALALWLYLNYFKASQNELFSSGSIAQFKHLIRLQINQKGHLIIYPIAIEKVVAYTMPEDEEINKQHLDLLKKHNGEDWNKVSSCTPDKNKQLQPEKLSYHLIEKPVIIKP